MSVEGGHVPARAVTYLDVKNGLLKVEDVHCQKGEVW